MPYNFWDVISDTADFAGNYLPQYAQQQELKRRQSEADQLKRQQFALELQKMNKPDQITSWPELFSRYAASGQLDQAQGIARSYTQATNPNILQPKAPARVGGGNEFGSVLEALRSGDPKQIELVNRALGMMSDSKKAGSSKNPKDYAAQVANAYYKTVAQYRKEQAAAEKYQYIPDPNQQDMPGQTPHGTFGYPTFDKPYPDPQETWQQSGMQNYLPNVGLNADSVQNVFNQATMRPPTDETGFSTNGIATTIHGQVYRTGPPANNAAPAAPTVQPSMAPPVPAGWTKGQTAWEEYVALKRKANPQWQP